MKNRDLITIQNRVNNLLSTKHYSILTEGNDYYKSQLTRIIDRQRWTSHHDSKNIIDIMWRVWKNQDLYRIFSVQVASHSHFAGLWDFVYRENDEFKSESLWTRKDRLHQTITTLEPDKNIIDSYVCQISNLIFQKAFNIIIENAGFVERQSSRYSIDDVSYFMKDCNGKYPNYIVCNPENISSIKCYGLKTISFNYLPKNTYVLGYEVMDCLEPNMLIDPLPLNFYKSAKIENYVYPDNSFCDCKEDCYEYYRVGEEEIPEKSFVKCGFYYKLFPQKFGVIRCD